ncbi:MAG: hypothetical protein IJ538_00650 [Clostridia bacterium]|nr:hypothetical protein [Clostridia bacterium]
MNFKKDLACNITLIGVLTLTAAYLTLLTLNLFKVTSISVNENFNYLVAYILIAVSLVLYILGFFATSILNAELPKWLRIMFYVAFFIFTNVYYFFNLHANLWAVGVMMLYIGFMASTIALSVFYNVQKDDKNRLKSTKKFITTTVFFYAFGSCSLIEFVLTLAKVIFAPKWYMTSALAFVTELGAMIIAATLMTVLYYLSLKGNKEFINSCLAIKLNKKVKKEKESQA